MALSKILLTTLLFLSILSTTFSQTTHKVNPKDFQAFIGNWKGSLTYLDYTSGKPYTMPAALQVQQLKNSNEFIISNIYPNEPKANSTDTLIISNQGKMINNETVKSKHKLSNGDTEIITELMGTDGNEKKPALMKVTYTIGKNIYKNIKEVQFVGENQWIKRHEYSYTRK